MKIVFTHSLRPLPMLISLFTQSRYSHCEFVFSDGKAIYPTPYSARVILTRKLYSGPNIHIIDLPFTEEQEQTIRAWADKQLGTPYDYNSLVPPGLDKIIKRKKPFWKHRSTWMCSEFCAYGLELAGMKFFPDDFKKVRPVDQYNKLINKE